MKYLSLVFSILWLLAWAGGGIALLFAAPWYVGVGCLAMSPWWLVYDLLRWCKKS